MKLTQKLLTAALSLGFVSLAPVAKAEYPGIYYVWKPVNFTIDGCLRKSAEAMRSEGLTNVRRLDSNNVAGNTDESQIVSACWRNGRQTLVIIMIAGDNEPELARLRDAMREAF